MQRSVAITENGRTGHVSYREPAGELSFYWEFGGGDVVAIVQGASAEEWSKTAPWAVERRAEILRFVAAEVLRQRAPSCHADIDEHAGCIYLRQGAAAEASAAGAGAANASAMPAAARGAPQAFSMDRWRSLRTKAAVGALVVAAIVGGLALLAKSVLMIDPGKGTPAGASLRTDAHVATLIQTLEPYIPSLHRDHSKDRYRLSVFIAPLDGAAPYVVPIAGELSPGTYSLAKVLGSDGRTLWFDAAGLYGVDLGRRALVGAHELRKANPSVAAQWWEDTRGAEVDGKLRLTARDRSQALEIDPQTLKASAVTPQRSTRLPFAPALSSYLAAGYCTSPTTWLGLHSAADLEGAYKPKRWVKCVERADEAKAMRRFYRGTLERGPDERSLQIVSMSPLGDAQYLSAAFLRLDDKAAPIRVANPDGALIAYTGDATPRATLRVARIDTSGAIAWQVDTGIDRFSLRQILPGERVMAFVGTRPPVPDKVSEPLLVLVDNATGRVTTHSLWQ